MPNTQRIEIYSTPTCQDCLALKCWITANGIAFIEYNLRDPAIADEAKRRTGVRVAPITLIDGEHIFYGTFQEQRPRIEAVHAASTAGVGR
jgi:glutaredoxin